MNEIINIIPYYLSVLLSVTFYNLCYAEINSHKINLNFKNIFITIIFSFIVFLNNCYNNLWIKFIFELIICCAMFKILFKDDLRMVIISYLLVFMLTIIIEVMFTIVLNKIGFLSNHKVVESNTILKIILSTLVYLWEYLLFLIPFIKKTSREIVRLFSSNINRLNIAYLLCITCFILGMLNIENFDYNGSIKLITILFVLFFLLGMLVINSITNQEYLKKSNERLVEYNDNYTKFLDEYKIYKHNINNKLVGMKAFGNKKINALIDDLLEEENTFTIKNNSLYNLPNGIKGIVAEKLYDLNINVIVTNKIKTDPFINLSPKSFNSVSECIGIALDNAIEASKETEEPVIIMDIYEDNNEIYVRIGNNFCNDIDINKLGQKYYSTKNRGSGLGLFSIKHNKIVKEKISIINNIFYIELKIKKHE